MGTNKTIENISSKKLQRFNPVMNDVTFIYKSSWIGYNHETKFHVELTSADGSVICLLSDELEKLDDYLDGRSGFEFDDDVPYCGQQYVCTKSFLSRVSPWINQTDAMKAWMASKTKKNKIVLTVTDVCVATVDAKWLCCIASDVMKADKGAFDERQALMNGDTKDETKFRDFDQRATVEPPSEAVIGADAGEIIPLNYNSDCTMQIGDRAYYTIEQADEIKPFDDWKIDIRQDLLAREAAEASASDGDVEDNDEGELMEVDEQKSDYAMSTTDAAASGKGRKRLGLPLRKVRRKKVKAAKRVESKRPIDLTVGSKVPVEVINTETKCTVVWQDGSEALIPSYLLYPVHHIDSHDFFCGEYFECANFKIAFR